MKMFLKKSHYCKTNIFPPNLKIVKRYGDFLLILICKTTNCRVQKTIFLVKMCQYLSDKAVVPIGLYKDTSATVPVT